MKADKLKAINQNTSQFNRKSEKPFEMDFPLRKQSEIKQDKPKKEVIVKQQQCGKLIKNDENVIEEKKSVKNQSENRLLALDKSVLS